MVVKQGMGQDVICGEQMREWEELGPPDRPMAVKRGHGGPRYSWVFQGPPAGRG